MQSSQYSRRENVKFENVPEEDPKEDTEMVLRSFLERELGFSDAANIEIQRVHRLSKKKEEKPRPILARFLRYKDCEKLYSLVTVCKELASKCTRIYHSKL